MSGSCTKTTQYLKISSPRSTSRSRTSSRTMPTAQDHQDQERDQEKPKYLKEDALTEECVDLMASLEVEEGWVNTHLYQYQGFWHTARQLQGVLTCQRHFTARDSDVLLVTSPKAGTTWLKAVIFAVVNRQKYMGQGHHPLLTASPHDLVPFLELKVYEDKDVVPDLSGMAAPRLFATHLPVVSLPETVMASSCKVVYLCRDPKDCFVSLWHFTNKLRPKEKGKNTLESTFDRYCRGANLYGPFWDHVLDYWKLSLEKTNKVLFLKYEEIKEQPALHVKKIAKFLECPFAEGSNEDVNDIVKLCSFEKMRDLEVNKTGKLSTGEANNAFFRKGQVGDGKNHLSKEMIQKMDRITEEKLHPYGLKFYIP